MKEISYQVQGSAKEPYNTVISINNSKIKCLCDCPAGSFGSHCKHWMSVFEGKKQKYINLNEELIKEIQSWLPGSDLEEIFNEFKKVKKQQQEIAAKKKKIYTELRLIMRDG